MPTLPRILKYMPAAVLGLLVVAWVVSVFRNVGFYSTEAATSGLPTCCISSSALFLRLDRRLLAKVEFDIQEPFRSGPDSEQVLGRLMFVDNSGGGWEHIQTHLGRYAVRLPFLILVGAILPFTIGPFIAFGFRLWHYLAYTALAAVELAYYLRWQE